MRAVLSSQRFVCRCRPAFGAASTSLHRHARASILPTLRPSAASRSNRYILVFFVVLLVLNKSSSLLLILKRKISHSMSRVKPTRNTARPSLYSAWVICNALILLPGHACWSEGQRHKMQQRSDWDAVKIDIMYRCFLLHYAHAPARAPLSALNT
jgi:hypothetical protein